MDKLKLLQLTFCLIAAISLFSACDDDDKIPTPQPPDEPTDSRALIVTQSPSGDNSNTNKNTTGNDDLDSRIEVPHVIGGSNNYILVRTTSKYGVNYIIEWDNQKRSQRWTAYQMHNGNNGKYWSRDSWKKETDNEWAILNLSTYGYADPFQPDPDLPLGIRTELNEYKNSGYSRGHICASADRLNSKEANEQTFYLSNIMPQSSRLNEGTWEKMENQVRNWNNDKYRQTLYVVKGGTIDDLHTLGKTNSGLVVPQYFFMAIVSQLNGKYQGIAFIVEHNNPNKNGTKLQNYVFTIDQLEQLTGIDFFCNLPDETENDMENNVNYTFWGMN